jgi:hypothetical protein
MKTQIFALTAGLLWWGIGSAQADFTVSDFQRNKTTSEETAYLKGLMDGIEITNALAQTGRPVFCTLNFFTSVEEFREFLDNYIRANVTSGKVSIASIAASALMGAYPCPGP